MILNIFEILGTLILGLGIFLDASKKASNPKFRLKALLIQQVGNIMMFFILIDVGLFFMSLLPLAGSINNIRNIRNRYLEMKKCIKK